MSAKPFLPLSARYNMGSKQRMRPVARPVGKASRPASRPMPASMQARRPVAEKGTRPPGKLRAWILSLFKKSPAAATPEKTFTAPQPVNGQSSAPKGRQGFTPVNPSARPANAQATVPERVAATGLESVPEPVVQPVAVPARPAAGSFERRPQRRVELPPEIKGSFGDMMPKSAPQSGPVAEFAETISTPPCPEPCAVSPAREIEPRSHGGVLEFNPFNAPPAAPEPEPEPWIARSAEPEPELEPAPASPAARSPHASSFTISTIPEEFPTDFIVMNRDNPGAAPELAANGATHVSEAAQFTELESELHAKVTPIPLKPAHNESAGIAIPLDVAETGTAEIVEDVETALVFAVEKEPIAPTPVAITAIPSEAERMMVSIVSVSGAWPDAVKQEIAGWNLGAVQLGLPVEVVEPGLKTGNLTFEWKEICSWMMPAPETCDIATAEIPVALPLSAVALAFFARQKSKMIPAGANGTSTANATPANTQIFSRHNKVQTRIPVLPKDATPSDIVIAAAGLEGVEGALIALPDGLRVASQLDASLDANLLSAMLPKAYLNMRSWTKDLRLGELSDLSFTAGGRTWKILRVNGLFFAAFGKAGVNLPAEELTQLAARLNSWEGH